VKFDSRRGIRLRFGHASEKSSEVGVNEPIVIYEHWRVGMYFRPLSTLDRSHSQHSRPTNGYGRIKTVAAFAALLMTCGGLSSFAWATPALKFSPVVLVDASLPAAKHFRTTQSGVAIEKVTIRPGGKSGWHMHSGSLMLLVKQGTLTNYRVVAGRCVRSVITAGDTYLEPPKVAHYARNEGKRDVVAYAVESYPKGGKSELHSKRPAKCHP
jgi:mannose-6-phosphate isomerase-like protein (cupin superfamily)